MKARASPTTSPTDEERRREGWRRASKIREIADRPVTDTPGGVNYREWLIGQALPACIANPSPIGAVTDAMEIAEEAIREMAEHELENGRFGHDYI